MGLNKTKPFKGAGYLSHAECSITAKSGISVSDRFVNLLLLSKLVSRLCLLQYILGTVQELNR